LIKPPGPFVAFEGADGVGKSTVIAALLPLLEDVTGLKSTLHFHWKPCRLTIRRIGEAVPPAQNPRGQPVRGYLLSFLYLVYHWLGFWIGWFRWVYPALIRSRPVVADRYAFDFFLDPSRFRLNLPNYLLRLAASTVPQPGLVIGLTADPGIVISRKGELTFPEIESYQQRLSILASGLANMVVVDVSGSAEGSILAVRGLILEWIGNTSIRQSHD
jgi:thymidylate kinase